MSTAPIDNLPHTNSTNLTPQPHTDRTTPHDPARAPLMNQEFCDHLLQTGWLLTCSPSLLRKFLGAIKPCFEATGYELRDADQRLTPLAQTAVEMFLTCDRDEDKFREQFFELVGFQPEPEPVSYGITAGLSVGFDRPDSNLLSLETIDIPMIEVERFNIGAVETGFYETRLARFQQEVQNYTNVQESAAATSEQIDAAKLAALQKSAIERAVRDHNLEEAVYAQTRAALAARQGLGK